MPIFLTPGDDDVSFTTANEPLEIYGLGGNDKITGGNAGDYIDGGDGNDTLRDVGGFGNDHFIGGLGDDKLSAIAGNDRLEGGDGNDALDGGGDDDSLLGGSGDDALDGEGEDDTLDGGAGRDMLFGGDGNDRLIVDGSFAHAADSLSGGEGNDVFVLAGHNFALSDTGGSDRVEASVSFSLQGFADLEELTLTGAAAIDGAGNERANTINGNDAANILSGLGGNDLIRGFGGNDSLSGGLGGGLEYLYGGVGDDLYLVEDLEDVPVEGEGQGVDTVQSAIRWELGNHLENLVLVGGNDINGFGNGLNNRLTGNSGSNYLDGHLGYDILAGGADNDRYGLGDVAFIDDLVGYGYDAVIEAPDGGIDTVYVSYQGNNSYTLTANVENGAVVGAVGMSLIGNGLGNILEGNAAFNALHGAAGNDSLTGGDSLDDLVGGLGDDTYFLNDITKPSEFGIARYDAVGEAAGEGNDTVVVLAIDNPDTFATIESYTLTANVENGTIQGVLGFNLNGNALANVLTGNNEVNILTGGEGNDRLFGGEGDDVLRGGLGNDVFVLGSIVVRSGVVAFDQVIEAAGEGIDTILVGKELFGPDSYRLDANIENGVAAYDVAFKLLGNALNNGLTGNIADNVLNGGAGADRMRGLAGNDAYYIDHAGDKLLEAAGGGFDKAVTSTSYVLHTDSEIESLSVLDEAGTAAIRLTGNGTAQTLRGNAGGNQLSGLAGADSLVGLAGADRLNGGLGADTLAGGEGRDGFIFDTALGAGNTDRLVGFVAADDGIKLDRAVFGGIAADGTLTAAAFRAGAVALDGSDRILYDAASGNIFYDRDGSGAAVRQLFARVAADTELSRIDFAAFSNPSSAPASANVAADQSLAANPMAGLLQMPAERLEFFSAEPLLA
jgi:Ca2+-binding RTX toxin-like protein